MSRIRIKRVYDPPSPQDGRRVLVDRLWPRGLKRDVARIDLWLKEVAPSAELRRWFDHDPQRWAEFQRRYREELSKNPQGLGALRQAAARAGPVTLVFAAKDTEHNNAVVLKNLLASKSD